MNKALFIISLQHELAMAIGNKLDLTAMLKVFLKVCFNRLSLTSAHIYINTDIDGHPIEAKPEQNNFCQHLLSIPKNKRGQPWQDNTVLIDFAKQLNNFQKNISKQCKNGSYLFGFIIPDHGLVILSARLIILINRINHL